MDLQATNDLMRETETAQLLDLAPATLRNMRSRREGPPYIRVGRSIRYSRVSVQKWLSEQTVRGGAA
ncbi:helix-turn-helix domain-containing protein [Pseudonocardia sp. ICBG601]|uniref:helix-turn-helix domain-containing protein n=1 Tax=Pseudonocardia sp. ICBG601 TaxID=2846759 RepID=UPI001CF71C67|nr:helix-turn-helix domain-containing protein [Pseudonocardia sp. ICBG601]